MNPEAQSNAGVAVAPNRGSARNAQLNRWLRTFFLGMAIVLLLGAGLVAHDLRVSGLPLLQAKTFWAALFGAALFVVLAWRGSVRAKFNVLLLLLVFAAMELLLQAAAWMGLLPAVNTKERLPWGRVYWTSEGRGNSIRNRFGWHFPEFNLARTNRVALIGDSFIEAVEVNRSRTTGAVLEERWRKENRPMTLLGLGNHGTGPAHYLEVLKYAHRHFGISEAVIAIYLGNDVTDSSVRLQAHAPPGFIFFELSNSVPVLSASGEEAVTIYRRSIESSHRPVWHFLPRLAASHSMSVQLPLSVRNARALRHQAAVARNAPMDAALAQLGLRAAPFAVQRSPEVHEAIQLAHGLLDLAAEFAHTHGITLRVVTIPFFPPDFYTQSGTNWTARVADHDFLALEQDFAGWAARRRVPFLALGETMRAQGLAVNEIRALYLSNGSGHFSEAGHRFAANAINSRFYDSGSNGAQ